MGTDLDLGSNVEESKVTGNKVMRDTSSLILQIISVTIDDKSCKEHTSTSI